VASNVAAPQIARILFAECKNRLLPMSPPELDLFGLKTGYVTGSELKL
jgi:hypothetical protein